MTLKLSSIWRLSFACLSPITPCKIAYLVTRFRPPFPIYAVLEIMIRFTFPCRFCLTKTLHSEIKTSRLSDTQFPEIMISQTPGIDVWKQCNFYILTNLITGIINCKLDWNLYKSITLRSFIKQWSLNRH